MNPENTHIRRTPQCTTRYHVKLQSYHKVCDGHQITWQMQMPSSKVVGHFHTFILQYHFHPRIWIWNRRGITMMYAIYSFSREAEMAEEASYAISVYSTMTRNAGQHSLCPSHLWQLDLWGSSLDFCGVKKSTPHTLMTNMQINSSTQIWINNSHPRFGRYLPGIRLRSTRSSSTRFVTDTWGEY